jgi:hypothetical protein
MLADDFLVGVDKLVEIVFENEFYSEWYYPGPGEEKALAYIKSKEF